MKIAYSAIVKDGRVVYFKEHYKHGKLILSEEISERQYVNENPTTAGIGYSASGLEI